MLVFKVQSNVIESSFGELGCKIIKRDSRPSRPFPPLFERGKLQKSCPSFPNFKTLFLSYYLWSSWWPQLSLFLRYSAHDPWNSPKSEIILSRQGSVTTRLPSEPLSVGGNLTQPRQKQEAKHEKQNKSPAFDIKTVLVFRTKNSNIPCVETHGDSKRSVVTTRDKRPRNVTTSVLDDWLLANGLAFASTFFKRIEKQVNTIVL